MAVTTAGARPSADRRPWIASIALAVAIVAIAAFAVRTLAVAPTSTAAPAPPAAAATPAAPAPAPPAGAPSTTDSTGRTLPARVATGVQGLYAALGTGDLAAVESRYSPSAALDAAPWAQVAPLLAEPQAREQLLAALRENPERRSGLYRYSADGARLGVDDQGRMAFLVLP